MARRRGRAAAALCALALLLCACGRSPDAPGRGGAPAADSVSLWYVQDALLAAPLESLAREYNAGEPAMPVELRAFADENALAAALDSARPDLLLCRHERAFSLYAQGRLKSLSFSEGEAPDFTGALKSADESVGRAFFPLGSCLRLLAVDGKGFDAALAALDAPEESRPPEESQPPEETDAPGETADAPAPAVPAAPEEALDTVEQLCALAAAYGQRTGQSFFSADGWAALFEQWLTGEGESFAARRDTDRASEAYRELYNLLAGAAYAGGLSAEEDAAGALAAGKLVCAALPSTALAADGGGWRLLPSPRPARGARLHLAECWGLAVTAAFDDSLSGTAAFLSWLCRGERVNETVLALGLLPALEGPWAGTDSELSRALRQCAEEGTLYFPAAGSGFCLRGAGFDEDFRAALALLRKT